MKKVAVLVLVLSTLIVFGCNAQRKPAPDPEPRLIPQESSIGFSQVDIDEVPASIQKIASAMENRPMLTWAQDNNNSYILLNAGQDEQTIKVNKVIQRVPVQDFLWLDVQLDYTDDDKGKNNSNNRKLVVVKLDNTDKAINGVGFEFQGEDTEDPEEEKPQATPAPTPAPTPTPTPTTRAPANQAKPTPSRETSPEERQPQNQTPEEDSETKVNEQQKPTPAAPNGD